MLSRCWAVVSSGRMLGARRHPARRPVPLPRSRRRRARERGRRAGRRRARRRGRARRGGAAARPSSPTSGRACPPTRPASSPADCPVRPGARSLEVSQDRLTEKETFRRARHRARPRSPRSTTARGLDAAVDAVGGLPAVLKTRRGGYDGKGQARAARRADVDARVGRARAACRCILESLVPFDRELSVLAVRGLDGDGRVLAAGREPPRGRDPAREPRAGTRRSTTRSRRAARSSRRACSTTSTTSACSRSSCSTSGGELLANEIAPRVHNSGHWTIEGADTSQFENHVRAVLGLAARLDRARSARARWSTASASCRHATRCSRCPARTCTTTARRPARAASSAT